MGEQHLSRPQFRRLKTKLGAAVATKAMAAKLARLVYRMLRYGMPYVDRGAEFYQAQHRQLQIKYLKWKAGNGYFAADLRRCVLCPCGESQQAERV